MRPYGTAGGAALLRALDRRVLPRALAPGLAGVVRLRIVDRRPGGGGPREVACRVGDDDEAAAAAPAPPRRIGAPLPRRSLADALDDDGGDDSDDSDDDAGGGRRRRAPRRDVVDVSRRRKKRRRRPWRRCGRDWRSWSTCRAHTVWPPSSRFVSASLLCSWSVATRLRLWRALRIAPLDDRRLALLITAAPTRSWTARAEQTQRDIAGE